MTVLRAEKEKGKFMLSACGHASGSPGCCAALSALSCSLSGYLQNDGRIKTRKSVLKSGEFEILFSGGRRARLVFEIFSFAFYQLYLSFPEYISFEKTKGIRH